MSSFPGRNPNPVMRVSDGGALRYANPASAPILEQLGAHVGRQVPDEFLAQLRDGARSEPPTPFELECGVRTFEILATPAPDDDAYNVYATDVTARKVVAKFPDRNPHPVLRVAPDGTLLYANRASGIITRALGVTAGERLPGDLQARIRHRLGAETAEPIEVRGEGRVFAISPVAIPEFGFINLYGTDVTATYAINKFPDENPHPVLRVTRSGTVTYANPASAPVCQGLGVAVGQQLPDELLGRVRAITDGRAPNLLETRHGGRIFELRVVSLFEFESINIYGTDVTAAREIARAHEENERLLLNILPASVAERLRRGEEPIADSFDEIAVLFADVVDFTPYSAQRPAREVVAVLNQIFSLFDRLVDQRRLEKIKTVGDAYMVVGGLSPDAGGIEEVADLALDILGTMERYRTDAGVQMQIRVGLQVGPAIGGVIGLKKFIYDVWGDTVNTASRMESLGTPGRIQVTAETAASLSDRYRFTRRGVIEVKGKGALETFYLVGRA
jgi:class 3 adenylate cyclase